MKWIDMTEQQQHRTLQTMQECGGGFAGKLAAAAMVADGSNLTTLVEAFSHLVEKYSADSYFYNFDDKVKERLSFKPVVKVAGNGDAWCGNALRFATSEEAATSAADLANRWMLVLEHGVQESTDPVTHKLTKQADGFWLIEALPTQRNAEASAVRAISADEAH